ncbi:tyrosine-type recombinase/integrase [Neptuniibacter sp.]|uniref:tyrosine-type recombinase/integrase n=1 Tax=Neptuniibacter sp. TaxID=1962643 RepID=UPI003B5CA6B8
MERKFIKRISYDDHMTGRTGYKLLNKETYEEIPGFEEFIRQRIKTKNSTGNSIEAWVDDLSCFFNYFLAVLKVIQNEEILEGITGTVLYDIVYSYPQYLTKGVHSTNKLARAAALEADFKAGKSGARRVSTLKAFFEFNESFHAKQIELGEALGTDLEVSKEQLFPHILKRKKIDTKTKAKLKSKSMLSGVISGGAKYKDSDFLTIQKSNKSVMGEYVQKAFPVTDLIPTISKAKNYRDRCLWCLLAGTGIRTHEATHLLISDVDVPNEEVKVIPFYERPEEYPHDKIKEEERLASKGRETQTTFFIEPFKTMFFDSLTRYMIEERPNSTSKVLFLTNGNKSRGKPLYLSSSAGLLPAFHKAQTAAGINIDERKYGLHSLRHFYGTWVLNYLPVETLSGEVQYGIDITTVRILMGHESLSSTEKYAVRDQNIIKAKIKEYNKRIKEHGFNPDNIRQSAIKAITSDISGDL